MESLLPSIVLLAGIHFAAMISPGPTAILVMRTGIQDQSGFYVYPLVAGIVCATLTNVLLTVTGVAALIAASNYLGRIIAILGALYLAYLGVKSLIRAYEMFRGKVTTQDNQGDQNFGNSEPRSLISVFRDGYIVNLLNPKIAIFYISIFSQVASPTLPTVTLFIFGAQLVIQSLIYWGTFASLARSGFLKNAVSGSGGWVDLIFGTALILFAANLMFGQI